MTIRITHVAIRLDDQVYSLPAPNRHHDVIWLISQSTGLSHVDVREEDQGFLDSSGRYLTRKQALKVAREANQLKPNEPVRLGLLFSENLW